MVEMESQYETDRFIEYIFSFLQLLEKAIDEGKIDYKRLETGIEQSCFLPSERHNEDRARRLRELKKILCGIRSLRQGNGDTFFVSLAQVFYATCTVPWDHKPTFAD
jgi:hypothetical protein